MLTTTLRDRGQMTLPAEIREALHIDAGALLVVEVDDGRIVLTPKVLVDVDQSWFWTERWQRMERQADEDFSSGRSKVLDGVDAFLDDLDA